jgi:transposase
MPRVRRLFLELSVAAIRYAHPACAYLSATGSVLRSPKYLKEAFQLLWDCQQSRRAAAHLEKWMRSAMRSRLEPFKEFVRGLRAHLDGVLAWTKHRFSSGAVEGLNNKIKSISHPSFGFRMAEHFIGAIYHRCARLPLPAER